MSIEKCFYWKIYQHYDHSHVEKWYEHKLSPPVVEDENVTVLQDFTIYTDHTIQANTPDLILKKFKCYLTNMTIPSVKEFERLTKYKNLKTEIMLKNVEAEPGWQTASQKTLWLWNFDSDRLPLSKFWI